MVFTDFEHLAVISGEHPQSVCGLVEAQVRKQPAATAIEFMGQRWTYQTLNSKANQLAHYLRAQGVGPDVLVGLYLDRSFEMIVGVLAILKAGGAYVPLDPSYPSERLAWILQDSDVSILLSQTPLRQNLATHSSPVVYVDAISEHLSQLSSQNPPPLDDNHNLAYIIYTSGSTGKPKGVMIEQAALTNFVSGANQACGIKRDDRVLQFASISFDTAIEEIFLTLTQGATLVLRTRDMLQSVPVFLNACDQLQITVVDLPTAFWHQICAELATTSIPHCIRLVIIGGERLLLNWLNVWKNHVSPAVRVVNGYGPTESTVVTTYCELIGPQAAKIHNGVVPIGKPLPNIQTHVLDETMQPIAPGEAGALYISGLSLARGYLNRPDLTDASFLQNITVNGQDQRVYRTGDLVRYRPDGHLEFLGRADNQEKIRGFRVELSEIETILEQHPAVHEAVAIAREDDIGIKRLVAYIVNSPLDQLPPPTLDNNHLETELIHQWRLINNNEQLNPAKTDWDSTFNISGWVNSYTGDLISDLEMQEWVNHTTSRILELNPHHVLEIGCGTGLLLFRIAPSCQSYRGIDISEASLTYIQQQLPQLHLPQVTLEHRVADNLDGIAHQSVDTVIINSVIQYFPSIDYLITVLEKAIQVIKPGGTLFLGDLRNYLLIEMFATSVELAQAPDHLPTDELLRRIHKRVHQEEELTLDPNFFVALQTRIPHISHVQILLKRGKFHNELTQFRYDVILHIDADTAAAPETAQLNWQQQGFTLDSLKQYLKVHKPRELSLYNIPNKRTMDAVRTTALLQQATLPTNVGQLKDILRTHTSQPGIDPESLWQLCQGLPYRVTLNCLGTDAQGTYGARFIDSQSWSQDSDSLRLGRGVPLHSSPQPWHTYGNNPLHSKMTQDLSMQLRSYIKQQLPAYMLPSAFVVLDKLPLTANGKINRRALPAPDSARPALDTAYIAPRNATENSLAELWAKVLNIHPIGIHDNFFELGGDSLRLIQLFSLVKSEYDKDISFNHFFDSPTIGYLTKQLQTAESTAKSTANKRLSLQQLRQETTLEKLVTSSWPRTPNTTVPDHWLYPQTILITGATGFIGISLLHELLQQTEATLYCLIRAQTLTQAYQKLRHTAQRYLPGVNFAYDRIVPLVGNLARPLLGLPTEKFQAIAEIVDTIYHSAANVNLLYPLSSLRATNVIGTKSILKLAAHKKIKPVHFVSTLDVFEPLVATGVQTIYEADDIDQGDAITGGYAQSKWIAETLITKALIQGIPTCIYRLGMITGHSHTGIGNPEDLLNRLIKSLIQLKTSPQLNLQIDMTPVDYVSQAIIHLAHQASSFNKAFHLINPTSFSLEELISTMHQVGFSIQPTPYDHWMMDLIHRPNALTPLSPILTETIGHDQITRLEMWLSGTQLFNCDNTLAGLQHSGISCPSSSHSLLKNYLNNLQ